MFATLLRFYKYVIKNHTIVFFVLVLSVFLATLTESIGISALLPVFLGDLRVDSNSIFITTIFKIISIFPGNSQQSKLLLAATSFFTLKILLGFLSQFWTFHLTNREELFLTRNLTKAVFNLDWEYFLSKDTGYYSGIINRETTSFANGFFAGVRGFTELLNGFFYFTLGLITAPKILLYLLPILLLAPVFKLTTKKIQKGAEELMALRLNLSSSIVETISQFKSSKSSNIEFYLSKINQIILNSIKTRKEMLFFESISQSFTQPFILIFLSTIFSYHRSNETIHGVEAAVFLAMIYRAASSFISSAQTLQSSLNYLPSLFKCLDCLEEWKSNQHRLNESGHTLSSIQKFSGNHIYFSYKISPKKMIINDMNFSFFKGDVVGFIGQSGSGKSTLINIAMGLLHCKSGSILINDYHLESYSFNSLKEKIAYVPQEPILKSGLLYSNFEHFNEITQKKYLEAMADLNLIGLDLYQEVYESGKNFSGGQKQRLALINAVLKKPEILILDEPTSGLDEDSKKAVINFILKNKEQRITIISTHDPAVKNITTKQIYL